MSDVEARLTAALHADAPPARDAIFRVEVGVRLEAVRFRRRVARTVVVAAVLAIVAAVNAPVIDAWLAADSDRRWIVVLAAAATLCALPAVTMEPGRTTVVRVFRRWLYL
jgi:hypothetical protein